MCSTSGRRAGAASILSKPSTISKQHEGDDRGHDNRNGQGGEELLIHRCAPALEPLQNIGHEADDFR